MWKTGRFVISVVVILSVVCISEAQGQGIHINGDCSGGNSHNCGTGLNCDNGFCKLAAGGDCSSPNTGNCTTGLKCESDICKLAAGGDCSSPNSDNCATGLKCEHNHCMPFPLNHPCDPSNECHNVNATCNTASNKCECNTTHYAHDANTCLLRKKVNEFCTIKTRENNECTPGAMCTSALRCECETENYYEDDIQSICIPRRGDTETCTHSQQCIRNAECPNSPTTTQATTVTPAPAVYCRCEQNYYYNDTGFKKCLPKLAPGVSCVDNDHCVDGATCDKQSNVCQCNSSTYEFNHTCRVRQILQGECDDTIPNQCLINGVCLDGRCQCDDHSFRKGDDCNATIAVGNSCDYFNREERQCESDTKCVFRYWDDGPVCGCDIDHFFNGHVCQPRALAGDPCPYDPNYLHDSLRLKIEHQCVDNAECSSRLICECKSTHYQRGQHCPPRIEVYGTCDPWANYYHQCVNGYACVHGRCV